MSGQPLFFSVYMTCSLEYNYNMESGHGFMSVSMAMKQGNPPTDRIRVIMSTAAFVMEYAPSDTLCNRAGIGNTSSFQN